MAGQRLRERESDRTLCWLFILFQTRTVWRLAEILADANPAHHPCINANTPSEPAEPASQTHKREPIQRLEKLHNIQDSTARTRTMNSLSIAAHRTALLASQRARPYYFARGCFMSTQTKEPAHPDKVAPDLRVMAGYMEYLDTMIAKTKKIEESMEDLKETYAKKRDIIVTWTDIPDIDAFFEQSGEQKAEISARLAELKTIMADAKDAFAVDGPHEAFAVDAPDGLPDALVFEEMQEIKHIIEEEAEIEAQIAKEDVDYQHKIEDEIEKTP